VHATGRTLGAALIALTIHVLAFATPDAATLPAGFSETLVTNALVDPTAMAFAPDGRLFVCQQAGQLRVIDHGVLQSTPFLMVIVDANGERGLLGVAFDPDFSVNQYVYVYYTTPSPAVHNRVSRFTADGNVAVPGSETVILELDNLSMATNHNGGAIHFGLDGKLFIGVGEHANGANAQTLTNLLGKMLRINADGTIPADNPFYNAATGKNRAIWAFGLRNPFTFAVQPGTGRIFIDDVGQNTWEEIDDGIAGSNYGWPISEGPTSDPQRSPLYYYGHGVGPFLGCAIAGGAFYNPVVGQFPTEFEGTYFFADLCGGWINRFDPGTASVAPFATGIAAPVDLQVGSDGRLYYLARGSGSVYKITYRAFTDDPVVPGTTPIRAVHITELRTRVDALRMRFGLPAFPWTDPSLGAGTVVQAIHVANLRTALQEAYVSAGRAAPEFSDAPLLLHTTLIRAVHLEELRNAVRILERS
jgi:glucose/arabinose dehydrogenase